MPNTHHYRSDSDLHRSSLERRSRLAMNGRIRRLLIVTALPLTLAVAGCGSSETTQSAATTSAAASVSSPAAADTVATTPSTDTTPTSSVPAKKASARAAGGHSKRRGSVLSSLGSAKPAPKALPTQRAKATINDLSLSSPAIKATAGSPATIPSEYTCNGANRWPVLRWGSVPANTKEIALFLLNLTPVNNKLYFDWAIAHVNPSFHEIQAGQLPPGTIVGQNSAGHASYDLCPPHHGGETYVFALFALPATLSPAPNFNPTLFREQALRTARHGALLIAAYAP